MLNQDPVSELLIQSKFQLKKQQVDAVRVCERSIHVRIHHFRYNDIYQDNCCTSDTLNLVSKLRNIQQYSYIFVNLSKQLKVLVLFIHLFDLEIVKTL